MKLYIQGKEAVVGMTVETSRGEKAILIDWRAPGELLAGKSGRVYCKPEGSDSISEWYPAVIKGCFK